MLPSLGQLPFLKSLYIGRLNGLETIGVDFFKKDDSFSDTPFPSLESLRFEDMPCWEVWHPIELYVFPQLKCLSIADCPRLRGDLPTHLPALEELWIGRCEQLASSLPRAPAIRRLSIHQSHKLALQELPVSLEELPIHGSEVVESMFEAITITQPSCLHYLEIGSCSFAISFPGDCLPASLKRLDIKGFRKLEFPKQNQQQHELLESLCIESSCDSLTSLALENFPNLRSLTITNCENLECLSLPDAALQNLTHFKIDSCHKFLLFPREGFPAPCMTRFVVSNCYNLKSLPSHMNTLLPKLKSLKIDNCPEVESFPNMPPSLSSLDIWGCEKLMRSPSIASMDMLTHLTIGGGPCDGVKSFPEEGLVLLPPSLTYLRVYEFTSVETLECKGLLHLTSLQQLDIEKCPKIENVVGERLPASLIKLQINRCPLLEERCQMKHPQIWPKISHIPGIKVNFRWIS